MGKQRVFLIVLMTIIIGIIAITAINWLDDKSNSTEVNVVRQDLNTLAEIAQAYALKPEIMGGGGGDFIDMKWSGLKELACNVSNAADTSCINENGIYTFTGTNDTTLIIYGDPTGVADSNFLAITVTPRSAKITDNTVAEN